MPSDTFKFVEAQHAPHPGRCIICGFDRRDFVDIQRDAEYYGAILICVECIQELTNVEQLPWVQRADFETQQQINRSLRQTVLEYEALRRTLEDGLVDVASNFTRAFDAVHREGDSELSNDSGTLQKNGEPRPSDGLFGFGQHSVDEAFI